MSVTGRFLWGPGSQGPQQTFPPPSTFAIDSATDAWALVTCMPKTGSITDVGVCAVSVTGNPPAYNVGMVTVDPATGFPTVAAFGGSAPASYDFTATGWHWITLATPAAVTAGDIAAARIWAGGVAPDAANCVTVYIQQAIGDDFHMLTRGTEYRGFWSEEPGQPMGIAIRYSDGSIHGLPCTALISDFYDSADTPDEVGAVFTLPFPCICFGARISLSDTDTPDSACDFRLYDSTGAVLGSKSVADVDQVDAQYDLGDMDVYWDEITLAAGTYRLTVLATDAVKRISPLGWVFPTAAERSAVVNGNYWQKTERTDLGAWTDTATESCHFALWLSSIL